MSQSKKSSITKTRRGRGVRSRVSSLPHGSAPLPGQAVVRPNGVVERASYQLSPRRTLHAGDRIRVRRGPYWQGLGADGAPTRVSMAERGTMTFTNYCELGDSAWVEATSGRGVVVLHVGPEGPSATVPGLVRRPYRITKVRKKNKGSGRMAT